MTEPTSRRLGPPQLWVFGGPNGAGKSTLAARQVRGRLHLFRRFDRSRGNLAEALRLANRAYVIDNSGERRRLVMVRSDGRTRLVSRRLPDWVERAVPAELRTPDPA